MKTFYITSLMLLLTVVHKTNAQTYERKQKESAQEFVKRIFPANALQKFKILEYKSGSEEKKIIFFTKIIEKDSSGNAVDTCININVLIPEKKALRNYSARSLKVGCNNGFDIDIENARIAKDKQKNAVIKILLCQLNRASTRLAVKNCKTFHLKMNNENFLIEEVKD